MSAAMDKAIADTRQLIGLRSGYILDWAIPTFIMAAWMLVYVGTAKRPDWLPLWLFLLANLLVFAGVSRRLFLICKARAGVIAAAKEVGHA